MRARLHVLVVILAATFSTIPIAICAEDANLPHLEKRGATTQLIVDGKPFLMLGGELFNSSSSSLEYMKPLWPRLAAIPLNTVLTPLSWELIEPTEGKYDFTLVDGLLGKPVSSTFASSSCGSPHGRTACPEGLASRGRPNEIVDAIAHANGQARKATARKTRRKVFMVFSFFAMAVRRPIPGYSENTAKCRSRRYAKLGGRIRVRSLT